MPESTEIVLRGNEPLHNRETALTLYDQASVQLAALATEGVSLEKFRVGFVYALQHDPALFQCTQSSVIRSVGQAVSLGLTFGGWRPEAHIVAYNQRGSRWKRAQLIPDYKGLVSLMRRRGGAAHVAAGVVYEGDYYEFEDGSNPFVKHRPMRDESKRGDFIVAWAVATTAQGFVHVCEVSAKEVDKIRRKAQSQSVWSEWPDEQRKKTAIRRLSKLLDLTDPQFGRAMQLADAEYNIGRRRALRDDADDINRAFDLTDHLDDDDTAEGTDAEGEETGDPIEGLTDPDWLFPGE